MEPALFYILGVAVLISFIYNRYKNNRQSEEDNGYFDQTVEPDFNAEAPAPKTVYRSNEGITQDDIKEMERDRILNALRALGCTPENVGDGEIVVKYQGENFVFLQRGYFITILDMAWGVIENISREQDYLLKHCCNYVNHIAGAKVQLSTQSETQNTLVETIFDFHLSFNQSEAEFQEFLTEVFASFFRVRNEFTELYHRLSNAGPSDNASDTDAKAEEEGNRINLSGKEISTDFGNLSLN